MTDEITPKEEPKLEQTEYEKLKAQNAEMEAELIKSRELKAESQKLEAERVLSGTSGGHVKAKPAEIDPIKYADSVLNGEIPNE